jgi:YYY domain-containing protein
MLDYLLPSFEWYFVLNILGIASFPLLFRICRNLWDRGYASSKLFGILLLTYLPWLFASMGILPYGRFSVALFFFIILSASYFTFKRDKKPILKFMSQNKMLLFANEALFLGAFILFVIVRLFDSSISDAEKPADFMLMNGAFRTDYFPFQDPWLSGYTSQNYYFGHLAASTLAKLTDIAPQVAYNLAVATFFSLTILLSFSIVYNLTQRRLYGFLGAVFVTISGNLSSILQIASFRRILPFDYWLSAHYIIPGTINEFPFFSFLHADLHAHMLALPFTLNILLLLLNYFKADRYVSPLEDLYEALCILALAFSLGALIINPIDMPTYAGLAVLSVLVNQYLIARRAYAQIIVRSAFILVPMLALSYLLYAPFHLSFKLNLLQLGIVSASTTKIHHLVIIFGLFLFVLISFMLSHFSPKKGGVSKFKMDVPDAIVIGFVGVLFMGNALLFLLFLFVLTFIVLLGRLTSKASGREEIFCLMIVLCGFLLAIACEVVYINDAFTGDLERVNTVFKVGVQIWVLFALSSAFFLFRMREIFLKRLDFPKVVWVLLFLGLFLISLLYPILATYTKTSEHYGFYKRPATLDGLDFLKSTAYCSFDAVRWLNQNMVGTPVVLESPGNSFTYTSCVSSNTGLPTVLGWEGHEMQWRFRSSAEGDITQRKTDVDRIYSFAGQSAINPQDVSFTAGREAKWEGGVNFSYETGARTGKKSLKIGSEDGANADFEKKVALDGGAFYMLSAWVKTENIEKVGDVGKTAQILIRKDDHDAPGDVIGETPSLVGNNEWKHIEASFFAPKGEDNIWITFVLGNWGNVKGSVWFDDVTLLPPEGNQTPSNNSASEVNRLLRKYNVSYVYVGPNEVSRYSMQSLAKFGETMDLVYGDDTTKIYSVNR